MSKELAAALERIEKLEGQVAALCREVGLVEVPEPGASKDPLSETRLGAGLGRFRSKVHALEEERRRG